MVKTDNKKEIFQKSEKHILMTLHQRRNADVNMHMQRYSISLVTL